MTPVTIEIPERFDRDTVQPIADRLDAAVARGHAAVRIDLSAVREFDSTAMALIVAALRDAKRTGTTVELEGISEPVLDYFSLVSVRHLIEERKPDRQLGFVERVGRGVMPTLHVARDSAVLFARAVRSLVLGPWTGERFRVSRTVAEVSEAGSSAMPIVSLIAFLLGLILAMQAWLQLRIFAAELFVADMVAVSVTREIGPLMTAILVAARSGSAIAAQIGTMVINEEVDALEQMGIKPVAWLVVPKMVALALATPCLTVLFDAVAMTGGMLFGVSVVEINPGAYLERTQESLKLADLASGLFKASVFGTLIASIGCALGLNVEGGPEGVGRATTRAVVASIFAIIVFDAIFVIVLRVGS
ncbi:MAG: MlaE family lipid ABC transporter permease subunit [Planctomycetes bacterium]|nr:MlaE family lipid ABC transporter permease subunit [Planctomycetota bacterium]